MNEKRTETENSDPYYLYNKAVVLQVVDYFLMLLLVGQSHMSPRLTCSLVLNDIIIENSLVTYFIFDSFLLLLYLLFFIKKEEL